MSKLWLSSGPRRNARVYFVAALKGGMAITNAALKSPPPAENPSEININLTIHQ